MTLISAHPKFAVLLAGYNCDKFIDQKIASIPYQKDVDLHLYISIDPSTDGTEIGIQRFAGIDSRVALLTTGGRFCGAVKNFYRLIRDDNFSSYDFISFSDQDDIWFPEKLSRAYILFRARVYSN